MKQNRESKLIRNLCVLGIILNITFFSLLYYFIPKPWIPRTHPLSGVVYGTFQGDIVHLDPVYAYDTASIDVINQVCETLYWFNLSDPNYAEVPMLATALPTVSSDGLEFTVPIRQGVKFHDNTTLDAAAVKFNFDRLMWFFNYSGTIGFLPPPFNTSVPSGGVPSGIPVPTQLFGWVFMNADGTPILNHTEIVDTYTVKFVLNQPRAAFFSILAFSGCSIISPTSLIAQNNENDYIMLNETLIGTGPFKFNGWTAGVEIRFISFEDYWGGRDQVGYVTFVILSSLSHLNQALLSGDIDILTTVDPAFINQFDANPHITLNYGGGTLTTRWISFKYPGAPGHGQQSLAMRKAISYCFNYSNIVDVVYDGIAVRLPTWIPMGIAFANYTLNYPIFNRTRAREILLNDATYGSILAGVGIDINSPDSAWTNLTDTTPLEHYNYSITIGSDLRHYIGDRLAYDMRYIGVACDVNDMAWEDLDTLLTTDRQHLGMFMMGWHPYYYDPENYINAIWSPTAPTNAGCYNETDVAALIANGMTETDQFARKQIYNQIQKLMIERDFPGMPLTTGLNYDAYKSNIAGWVSNPFERLWFYPLYGT
jgi:ABC-type transport system substrate-binding protein